MSFVVYDLIFLALFTIFAVQFLYKRKKHIKRQGWIFLYHTKIGLSLMETLAKRGTRTLRWLQYVIISSGYILLVVMTVLLVQTVYTYVTSPFLARALKIPPLLPLFPYFPQIFKIESLFPPFYFTYFLVALAIVAVSHEFAHGVLARFHKIRIKSTGFAFFGPFFGAFVEQDDKDMQKAKKVPQLSVLAAGTFANIIMTVIFGLVLWGFFAASFAPGGVYFTSYATAAVSVSSITTVNGIDISQLSQINQTLNQSLTTISTANQSFFIVGTALAAALEKNIPAVVAYEDSPALEARLGSPILSIEGVKIRSLTELREQIVAHGPGENVTIVTMEDGKLEENHIVLGQRDGKSYLGIGVGVMKKSGIGDWIRSIIASVKDPYVYYVPVWGGDFAWFIYYLLWWIVLINLLVALFNMLPVSILDGGRFFYLTIWGLTGSEKAGKRAFTITTWLFVALLALMMVRWVFAYL